MGPTYVPTEPRSAGDLTFFADFENASDDFDVEYRDGRYRVSPYSWMHFGVRGTAGTRPTFTVDRPDHVDERRRLVWSTDGREWSYFDDATVDGDVYEFGNEEPFDSDRVFVAALFPYTLRDLQEQLRDIRESPYVGDLGPRGHSPERRPIYGLAITDPSVPESRKHDVVCLAGQHAWEGWGRQVCHGLIEAAVSGDPAADRLRKKVTLRVYPMVNPDGIVLGHSRDGTVDHNPNRAWVLGAPPDAGAGPVPEVDVLRRTILDETRGEAAYLIDCHSHAGWYDPFMWYANADDPGVVELVEAVHGADDDRNDGAVVGTDVVGGPPTPERKTSTRWAIETLGATAVTFEATPYSSPSRERYRAAGHAFVDGLDAVIEAEE